MTERPVSVDRLRELADRLAAAADAAADATLAVSLARHDGYRAQARRLEEVDEALADVERLVGPIREQVTDLRRRWNDPDA